MMPFIRPGSQVAANRLEWWDSEQALSCLPADCSLLLNRTNPARIATMNAESDDPKQSQQPASASVHLQDAVARHVEQTVHGAVSGGGKGDSAQVPVASISVHDGVVKEIRQTVNMVNVLAGDLEDWPSYMARNVSRPLRTRYVLVACGREILAYDPSGAGQATLPAKVYRLPAEMGSARSVRVARLDRRLVFVAGARKGVVLFDAASAEAWLYPFPTTTMHGANSVAVLGHHLYATHSDLGLLRWPVAGGDAALLLPEICGQGCRALQATAEGWLLLCAGHSVRRFNCAKGISEVLSYSAGTGQVLTGVVEDDKHLYGTTHAGLLVRWDKEMPGMEPAILKRLGRTLYDLAWMNSAPGRRLVLSAKDDAVHLVRLGKGAWTAQFPAPPGVTLRYARAADDYIVAVDSDRSRLFIWPAREEPRPARCLATPRLDMPK